MTLGVTRASVAAAALALAVILNCWSIHDISIDVATKVR